MTKTLPATLALLFLAALPVRAEENAPAAPPSVRTIWLELSGAT